MQIEVKIVDNDKMLREFVELPYKLYAGNRYWVPPMKADELKALRADGNPAMDFCQARLWVAFSGGRCVGRIGAIVNRLWIEKNGRNYGRLTRFESIDDLQVATLLLRTAEDWLRAQGMDHAEGPLGFTNLDHQGLLVEGHDWLPSVASDYSAAYYSRFFEANGYRKEIDWLEFRLTFPAALPQKSLKVAAMLKQRYGLRTVSFSTKAELAAKAPEIFDLFNEAFGQLFGTYRFPQPLIDFYISKYMPILVPRYVKMVEDAEGRAAGFIIALPSLSRAMQKAGGRLLPLGWWHLMRALRHPREIDLLLTGVRPELQKLGVAALLMNELWETAHADGVTFVETTGMLENNHVAIQMWKSFEHIQHKRKRCYLKKII